MSTPCYYCDMDMEEVDWCSVCIHRDSGLNRFEVLKWRDKASQVDALKEHIERLTLDLALKETDFRGPA